MKFFIDNVEIQTVIKGATISGSLNLVSRTAAFSYFYSTYDLLFKKYKAKIGSSVLIKNNSDKKIFIGKITEINYIKEKNIVQIQAQDMLYPLMHIKTKGRFQGEFLSSIKSIIKEFSFAKNITAFFSKQINILNLGGLSLYDILQIAIKKIYGDYVKIYIDGSLSVHILMPKSDAPKAELVAGKNIISCFFSTNDEENRAKIIICGNENIVSGMVVKIIDTEKNISGTFVVESDKHVFKNTYTTELNLIERKFF